MRIEKSVELINRHGRRVSVAVGRVEHLLAQGFIRPAVEEYAQAVGVPAVEGAQKTPQIDPGDIEGKKVTITPIEDEDDIEALREQAKAAGIGHYWSKGREKLLEELAAVDDEG